MDIRQYRDTDNKAASLGKRMDIENGVFLGVEVQESIRGLMKTLESKMFHIFSTCFTAGMRVFSGWEMIPPLDD